MFVAVELPEPAHEAIERGIGHLKKRLPPARWVRREAMHVTLKFMGEQPESTLGGLDGALKEGVTRLAPVEVALGGGGFFPHDRRPRVAWLGGRADGLERWAMLVDESAANLGVEREPRPFSLHVTLARLERPWGKPAVETFVADVAKWTFAPFQAREMVLFQSELTPSGAVYTPLRRWTVGG